MVAVLSGVPGLQGIRRSHLGDESLHVDIAATVPINPFGSEDCAHVQQVDCHFSDS